MKACAQRKAGIARPTAGYAKGGKGRSSEGKVKKKEKKTTGVRNRLGAGCGGREEARARRRCGHFESPRRRTESRTR